MTARRCLLLSALALAAAWAAPAAWAQETAPLRIVVPYPPGGPLDATARVLAERVQGELGTVVVDNKPGAGGNIGMAAVAKAVPDGRWPSTPGCFARCRMTRPETSPPSLPWPECPMCW